MVDGLLVEALLGLGAMKKMDTRIDTKREMIEIGNLKYSYSEKVYAVGMRDGCYLAEDKLPIRGVGVEQKIMIIEVKNGKELITIDNNSEFLVKIKEDAEIVEIEGKFFLLDGCMEEGVKIGPKLNRAQRRRVMMLIKKYWNGFGNKLTGKCSSIIWNIKLR